jgi:hypothetical protein
LLALSLVAGALLGALAYAASHLWYMVFVFALLMAVAGALLQRYVIREAQVRNRRQAALYAALLGLVIYASFQVTGYLDFRSRSIRTLSEDARPFRPRGEQVLEQMLVERTGAPGPVGYLRLRAQHGEVHIIRLSGLAGTVRTTSGIPMRPHEVWLYWLVELGLIVASMVWSARINAARPFCESGPGWYAQSLKLIGAAAGNAQQPLLAALQVGDVATAAELMEDEEGITHPRVEVYAQRCPGRPAADALITLKQTTLDRKGLVSRRRVLRGELTAEEFAALTQARAGE